MAQFASFLACASLHVLTVGALKIPAVNRRSAIAGIAAISLPSIANAGNPLSFSGEVEFKQRNYGDDVPVRPAAKGMQCAEGERLTPDGFGGKKCVSKVKPIAERVVDGVVDVVASPPAQPSSPPLPAKTAPVRSSSSSSSAPLTFTELLDNSIKQKEGLLGRDLSAQEKAEMTNKLKALMGI